MGASIGMKVDTGWRKTLRIIIFEADTPAGKAFDVALILSILISVVAVMLDSVAPIRKSYGGFLYSVECFFTLLFTVNTAVRSCNIFKSHRKVMA
jgi:voltage-gated potassium channel